MRLTLPSLYDGGSIPLCLPYSHKSTGEFQAGAVVKPDDLAACQVTPGSEWILAKVIQHDPVSGMYKLADEDVESDKGLFGICTRGFRD
jgi:hypothetical protein